MERTTRQVSDQAASTAARGAQAPELLPVSGRMPVGLYILELWENRHFISTQAFARASTRYEGMLLGNLWMVLSPMLDAAGFFLIFSVLLKVDRGIPNFPAFLVVGIYLFTYSSRSVTAASGIIRSNKALVRAFSFPRMALVLSAILREAVMLIPTVFVMFAFVLIIRPPSLPTKFWLLVPVVVIVQTMFNLGLALIIARASDKLPDLQHLISFVTRFWMYLSGVMFSIDRFVDNPIAYQAIQLNPTYQVIDMARDLILYNTQPAIESWLILANWAFATLIIGFFYFWAGEVTYGKE